MNSFFNLIDFTEFTLYVYYFIVRFRTGYTVYPDRFWLDMKPTYEVERSYMPLIHFILFMQVLTRTMFFIRVFEGVGT